MPVTTRNPDLENCASRLTRIFMTRCPVAKYIDGSPGRLLVEKALYGLLEDGYIEVGTELFKGVPERG